MSTKTDQEEKEKGLTWTNAGQLKDWFVNVLKMNNDQQLEVAARTMFKNGGTTIDHLRNIGAPFLTSIGVNGFVAQALANKLRDEQLLQERNGEKIFLILFPLFIVKLIQGSPASLS